eukprot:PITA_07305
MKLGFTRSEADPNLYFKVENDKPLILVLYVDDLFLTGADPLIHKCKRELAFEFVMKNLGLMHYFLELEVWQKPGEIFLSQGKYVVKILERFGMVDCKPVTTPMELNFKKLCGSVARSVWGNAFEYHQLVGALMFLVNSPPNICFAVNIYWCLDWCQESSEISSGHNHSWTKIHCRKCEVAWKQKSVALNIVEGEYISVSMASCEAVWLRKHFKELFGHMLDTIVVLCNNQSGIHL